MRWALDRRRALLCLGAIILLGAALRFYGLRWAAPYFHFHMDEHYVFLGANQLRTSMQAAADLYKFFMYPPLVMHIVNAVRTVYEWLAGPLDLTRTPDGITYMVMGRTISALLGTATIPMVYLIAARVSGRAAGLLAAFLLAVTVLHLRDSHFFTTDIAMVFLTVVTWWLLLRVADGAGAATTIKAGIVFGMAVAGKYTAVFLAPLIALAHVVASPIDQLRTARPWVRRLSLAALAGTIGLVVFLLIDPMVLMYPDRFREDIQEQVVGPVLGTDVQTRQFAAQFADINSKTYWFTNNLWWGLGPALEIWALVGVAWLLVRRDRMAFMAAAFPIVYWLVGSRSIVPFPRYALPLMPPLAVCAACLSIDWLKRPRLRLVSIAATSVVVVTTAFWALAYTNIYRHLDTRLEAGRWAMENIPPGAKVLVEPSQGTPPMGSYLANVDFNTDYVVWRDEERDDHFHLIGLDMYRSLWNRGVTDEWRREYIKNRLAMADWIVMDDHYVVQYSHQPEGEHSVVKEYYRDLFAEKLDFKLVKTFKVYPSLFGITINDDDAELTWHDLDHARVYVFRRFRAP